MAHFAKLGIGNKIERVEVVHNNVATTEQAGVDFLNNIYKSRDVWKQTSYNTIHNTHKLGGTPFRGNYAGIGYSWDEDNNIFWPKSPYTSWVKDTTTPSWKSPIGDAPALTAEQEAQNTPADENTPPTHKWYYVWNEANQSWDLTDTKA